MIKFLTNRKNAYLISFILHIIILGIFSFVSLGTKIEELDYVTVDFGSPGTGRMGESPITEKSNTALEEILKETKEDTKQK